MTAVLRPVVYQRYPPSAFVRVLESVALLTDYEPTASFVDEEVVAAGEQLFQVFQTRLRDANDLQGQDSAASRASDPTLNDAQVVRARHVCGGLAAPGDEERNRGGSS